ncbi:hypothetical protein [Hymenobacter sp. GOD-10R]|uniref:hypothetical protein n=1 Tax=Hymenobacter sp. GOD-10R TaxID=3093922 RepID=UPI002D77459A|nr:hypothetical protein [Hymenobacter sp. GOD-10R]WRQ27435.1 hypothetical protein SD425_20400 [Hymenobacter sp. GOD-10R]
MTILLTRDPVASSDDLLEHRFIVPSNITLADILQIVLAQRYLATIAGGKATWVAHLQEKPIAVLAQQWQQPVLLSDQLPLLDNTDLIRLHLRYYNQQDPEEVLSRLRSSRG